MKAAVFVLGVCAIAFVLAQAQWGGNGGGASYGYPFGQYMQRYYRYATLNQLSNNRGNRIFGSYVGDIVTFGKSVFNPIF